MLLLLLLTGKYAKKNSNSCVEVYKAELEDESVVGNNCKRRIKRCCDAYTGGLCL